jgi:ferredoxin/flavodoxin---NADP+ reductase
MDAKFTRETITWIEAVTPKLFRFRTTRPAGFRFAAGQWARLGVESHTAVKPTIKLAIGADASSAEPPVWRAYSIASAHYAHELEFYSIVVPNGAFTTQLSRLAVGDTLLVEKLPYGFLTTARFQTTRDAQGLANNDLWLLSTGTGLAPFISIVQDLDVWQDYARIIVVHGVRESAELAYASDIAALRTHELFAELGAAQAGKLVYLPVVSRETPANTAADAPDAIDAFDARSTGKSCNEVLLHGRITDLLLSGALETAAGCAIEPQRSRVMICGNPDMVTDTRSLLKARGLSVSRNAAPGQIAVENYW